MSRNAGAWARNPKKILLFDFFALLVDIYPRTITVGRFKFTI
jgi:hypothetical protein